jgi:hypothetical protein
MFPRAGAMHDACSTLYFAGEATMAVKSVKKLQPIEPDAAAPGQPEIPDDETRKRIAEVAYYRAQQRGFSPGCELEDWLAAEAQIRNAAGRSA